MSRHLRLRGLLWLPLAGLRAQTTSPCTQVAAGQSHSLALRSDGSLWAWGANNDGRLGVGSNTVRSTAPAAVGTPATAGASTRWTQVAAGQSHSLVLRADGTLWA